MKIIMLTQGQTAIVDDADYEHLKAWKWQAHWNPCTRSFYACRTISLTPGRGGKKRTIWMHRELLGLVFGDGKFGDHILSGETLDNRRANLRVATRAQNSQNRRMLRNNTSGFIGVYFKKSIKKWIAQIRENPTDKQQKHLGCFFTPQEASFAYCESAIKHRGEFARTT